MAGTDRLAAAGQGRPPAVEREPLLLAVGLSGLPLLLSPWGEETSAARPDSRQLCAPPLPDSESRRARAGWLGFPQTGTGSAAKGWAFTTPAQRTPPLDSCETSSKLFNFSVSPPGPCQQGGHHRFSHCTLSPRTIRHNTPTSSLTLPVRGAMPLATQTNSTF